MFDNCNPYTLRMENIQGLTRYFVSFMDEQSIMQEIEVSRPVYVEFLSFIKTERNLRRWDERHIEQSDLRDETLYSKAIDHPKSIEDTVFDDMRDEQLRLAIQCLPEIQRRRFILYHEFDLTYEQISEMEGCTKVAVKYAIDKAKTAITKKLEKLSE
ncbi:MAG: sigma-70 region 4 domain-containing protein [Firmicutes bacterium]|nr:sigma-70 region 4 domain-containing protein [Bacillota bacterium]